MEVSTRREVVAQRISGIFNFSIETSYLLLNAWEQKTIESNYWGSVFSDKMIRELIDWVDYNWNVRCDHDISVSLRKD